MDLNKLRNALVYSAELDVVGVVAGINIFDDTVVVMVGEEFQVLELGSLEILEEIGFIGKESIHNHDVVVDVNGKAYEIELNANDTVTLHEINNKLERLAPMKPVSKTDLAIFEGIVELVGNIRELEPTESVDFNIRIVRDMTGGKFNCYFYACNNVEKEEVDLIKVVFVGSTILPEEKYERVTVSHDEYLDMVELGDLKEVNPQELQNYVTGLTYGTSKSSSYNESEDEDEDFEEDFDEELEDEDEGEEVEYCDECGNDVEYCDCDYDWE